MRKAFQQLAVFALAALSMGAASGCMILPKPKPFSAAVAARQMDHVTAPAPEAPIFASLTAPDRPFSALPAASEPPRNGVRGKDDGSMKLDKVFISGKDIAHRAPEFSSEQAAAMTCASLKYGFNGSNAKRMHAATVATEQAERDLDAGRITLKQFNKIDEARQDAVLHYLMPVPLIGLFVSTVEKKSDFPKPAYRTVQLEHTDLFTFTENGREVIAVSGVARNTGDERVELPPLTLRAIDQWDFSVGGQTSLLPFESLGPGEARKFEVRFLNPPKNTAEVYAHFAPPFLYRAPRDCDFFDPSKFDPSAKLDAISAGPRIIPPSNSEAPAPYTAAELNILTIFYRQESEAAWRCQTDAKKQCPGAETAQRLRWRDMFAMAEAIDEAWVALNADGETRRKLASAAATQQEVETADLARRAATDRFREMGARALARAGGSAPDVKVDVATSSYGRDASGLYVEIGGTVTNTSNAGRKVDALMIAFVDRLELPLSSIAVPIDMTLAPGESRTFSQRLAAGVSRGPNRAAPATFAERRSAAPLVRLPPRDIAWQVRVGAMARQ